jgi:hypothetical protein
MVAGVYLMWQGAENNLHGFVLSSAVFFAAACWSRTESPLLILIGVLLAYPLLRRSFGSLPTIRMLGAVVLASGVAFALWHVLFMNAYLPVRPSTADQIAGFDAGRLVDVISTTWTSVIARIDYWGIVVWLFIGTTAVSIVLYRRITSGMLLVWIAAILIGLWFSGTLFTAAIVEQTLRRGMFKLIPLLVLAIAASELVTSASNRLSVWEQRRSS